MGPANTALVQAPVPRTLIHRAPIEFGTRLCPRQAAAYTN